MVKIIPTWTRSSLALRRVDLSLGDRNKYINGGYISELSLRYSTSQPSQLSQQIARRRQTRHPTLLHHHYCTPRGGGGTTLLADRFMVLLPPPSVTGRIDEYDEYDGWSDAKRTGGRRNRCLSSRPVEGVGADTETETEHGVPVGGCSSHSGCDGNGAGVELAGVARMDRASKSKTHDGLAVRFGVSLRQASSKSTGNSKGRRAS
jgi:hypothetical protein